MAYTHRNQPDERVGTGLPTDPYVNPYGYAGRGPGSRSAGIVGLVILALVGALVAFSWLAA